MHLKDSVYSVCVCVSDCVQHREREKVHRSGSTAGIQSPWRWKAGSSPLKRGDWQRRERGSRAQKQKNGGLNQEVGDKE